MALFSIEGKQMTGIPHREAYDRYRSNLKDEGYNAIIDEIHRRFEQHALEDKPINSSHIPGNKWEGTVWMPIYGACAHDMEASGLFFGQLVWDAAMQHPESWYFKKDERPDGEPAGTIYWLRRD